MVGRALPERKFYRQMKYDFDHIATPRGFGSVKWEHRKGDNGLEAWDATKEINGHRQVLPMWVADMDFPIADPIRQALVARVNVAVTRSARPKKRNLVKLIARQQESI